MTMAGRVWIKCILISANNNNNNNIYFFYSAVPISSLLMALYSIIIKKY